MGVAAKLEEIAREATALLDRVKGGGIRVWFVSPFFFFPSPEKERSSAAVAALGPELSGEKKAALERLCDLHAEYLALAALLARHAAVRAEDARLFPRNMRENNDPVVGWGGRGRGPRADPPRPRNDYEFDPNAAEPDPDQVNHLFSPKLRHSF